MKNRAFMKKALLAVVLYAALSAFMGCDDGLKVPEQYTVTFDADGGSPAERTRMVNDGGTVGSSNMPSEPTQSGYAFDAWHTQRNGGGDQFTASTTGYNPMTSVTVLTGQIGNTPAIYHVILYEH
jgi:hypothetical protein